MQIEGKTSVRTLVLLIYSRAADLAGVGVEQR